MKKVILSIILAFLSSQAVAQQVPYYKVREEEGRECRYYYSGVQNGKENLVNVQCFDDKRR